MKKLLITAFLFTLLFSSRAYALNNSVESLSYEEKSNITSLLSACADIMRFDRENYNFDTLMKYILCTHENFAIITNLSPETNVSGSDANGISIVNGDYIDSIVTNIFNLVPEHPSVEALVDRGFCYSNGLYYYRNIFTADFHTQIGELTAVYNLGGGILYISFNDTYYENNTVSPEKSFAVIQKSSPLPYSLVRLGMGEKPLPEAEIISYTPLQTYQNPRWQTPSPDYVPSRGLSLYTLIAIIAVSAVIFIFGSVALVREIIRK